MAEQEERILDMTEDERATKYGRCRTVLRGMNRELFDEYTQRATSKDLLDLANHLCKQLKRQQGGIS
jgi:hypothetical protein